MEFKHKIGTFGSVHVILYFIYKSFLLKYIKRGNIVIAFEPNLRTPSFVNKNNKVMSRFGAKMTYRYVVIID